LKGKNRFSCTSLGVMNAARVDFLLDLMGGTAVGSGSVRSGQGERTISERNKNDLSAMEQ